MGTNYYLHEDVCPQCGRSDDPKHIGKSSGGWCFALHVGNDCPDDLDGWSQVWQKPGAVIRDEYGNGVHPDEMLRIISERTWGTHRHVVDGRSCVGHGPGTWDLITGEFS